jgi:hypothetical protein
MQKLARDAKLRIRHSKGVAESVIQAMIDQGQVEGTTSFHSHVVDTQQ